MVKKLKLDIDYSEEYRIIGISSHLKDYRLAYFVNKQLQADFRKIQDFPFQPAKDKAALTYSFYYYRTPEEWFTYCLIGNYNAYGRLANSLWQYDYFFFISGPAEDEDINFILGNLREIPHVLIANEIAFNEMKNSNYIVADIEMHLIHNKLIN